MRSTPSDLSRELEEVLSAAREEFIADLPARISKIDALLADLGTPDLPPPDAAAAPVALRHEMHRIAGICGTIGFTDLARDGARAEEILRPLATGAAAPQDATRLGAAAEAVTRVRAGLLRAAPPAGS